MYIWKRNRWMLLRGKLQIWGEGGGSVDERSPRCSLCSSPCAALQSYGHSSDTAGPPWWKRWELNGVAVMSPSVRDWIRGDVARRNLYGPHLRRCGCEDDVDNLKWKTSSPAGEADVAPDYVTALHENTIAPHTDNIQSLLWAVWGNMWAHADGSIFFAGSSHFASAVFPGETDWWMNHYTRPVPLF